MDICWERADLLAFRSCCLTLCCLYCLYSFPVWCLGILSLPDHCLFVYLLYLPRYHKAMHVLLSKFLREAKSVRESFCMYRNFKNVAWACLEHFVFHLCILSNKHMFICTYAFWSINWYARILAYILLNGSIEPPNITLSWMETFSFYKIMGRNLKHDGLFFKIV